MRIEHTGASGPSIMIGIPSRSQMVYLGFASSLMMLGLEIVKKGWTYTLRTSNNSCFVDCARNQLVAAFMHSECTHLLMIDDDMKFEPEKVIEMIEHDKDFICAVGNLKSENPRYACQPYTESNGIPLTENGLIWAKGVGGAFTIHKRVVFEKLMNRFTALKCKTHDEKHNKYGYGLYHTSQPPDGYRTEDQNFCDLWAEVGGKIWVYPDMNFGHFGTKEYKGNYHEYLMNLPQPVTV